MGDGRNFSSFMTRMGITNKDSEDLSGYQGNPPKYISFSFCCSKLITNVGKSFCPKCDHALFWETYVESIALPKMDDLLFPKKRAECDICKTTKRCEQRFSKKHNRHFWICIPDCPGNGRGLYNRGK